MSSTRSASASPIASDARIPELAMREIRARSRAPTKLDRGQAPIMASTWAGVRAGGIRSSVIWGAGIALIGLVSMISSVARNLNSARRPRWRVAIVLGALPRSSSSTRKARRSGQSAGTASSGVIVSMRSGTAESRATPG